MKLKFNRALLKQILFVSFFAAVVFLIDQVVKRIIFMHFLFSNKALDIFPFFKIQLIYNYGVSFSILNGLNTNLIVVISTLSLLVLITIFYLMFDFSKPQIKFAVGLIVGAALGNIYDRVTFGAVIDFLNFHIRQYSFPIFNFADIFITLSALILIFDLYIARRKV